MKELNNSLSLHLSSFIKQFLGIYYIQVNFTGTWVSSDKNRPEHLCQLRKEMMFLLSCFVFAELAKRLHCLSGLTLEIIKQMSHHMLLTVLLIFMTLD